jgi:nucleotide-binding universal stress UspA family protein
MRVQLKSIICTTDFSDYSNHSIRYGIALAKEFRAKLYVCHVVDLPSAGMYGETIPDPVEQQHRIMNYTHEQLKEFIGEESFDWEPLITVGHAASEIARMAEEKEVDLAISATHGRSGLRRLILGSVTERLMRTLPCPLLVVRTMEHDFITPTDQEIRLQRILVGCDFSPDSSVAFQYGLSLAQEFQSDLHLVHVIPPIHKNLPKHVIETRERFQQDFREELLEKLKDMVPKEAFNWCTPKTTLLAGDPHEELIKYAVVQGMDLIVLGVRGHSLVETLFVGSTTDRVVRRSLCPVLTVRPIVQDTQES